MPYDSEDPFGGPPGPDLDEQFSFQFAPEDELVPGLYPGKCKGVRRDVSKAGNPMYVWDFKVTGGPYTGEEYSQYTALTDAAAWKLMETADALGIEHPDGALQFTLGQVADKPVLMELEVDEYRGRKKLSLKSVQAPGSIAAEPVGEYALPVA